MASGVPGYVAIGIDIVTFRKRLWTKFKINRYQFAEMLQRLRDRYSPYTKEINLSGGPIYHKDDWVECNGRYWLHIEVKTEDHKRQMAPHRS
jgi:hypothetical protein